MKTNLILLLIILYPIYHAFLVMITTKVFLRILENFLKNKYLKLKTDEKKKK